MSSSDHEDDGFDDGMMSDPIDFTLQEARRLRAELSRKTEILEADIAEIDYQEAVHKLEERRRRLGWVAWLFG